MVVSVLLAELILERSTGIIMHLQFTPWVALVLGLLLGWLLEWLFELFRFRRSRLACQQRLASLEAELAARKADVRTASDRIQTLQADLAAWRGGRG